MTDKKFTLIAFRAGQKTLDRIKFLLDNFQGSDYADKSDLIREAIRELAHKHYYREKE